MSGLPLSQRRLQARDPRLPEYVRVLRDYPAGPGVAEAHLGAGRVQLEAFGHVAPAYQHFLEGLEADPSPATEQQIRLALRSIAERQKYAMRRFTS